MIHDSNKILQCIARCMNQRILESNNVAFSTEPSLRQAFFIGLLFIYDILSPKESGLLLFAYARGFGAISLPVFTKLLS